MMNALAPTTAAIRRISDERLYARQGDGVARSARTPGDEVAPIGEQLRFAGEERERDSA